VRWLRASAALLVLTGCGPAAVQTPQARTAVSPVTGSAPPPPDRALELAAELPAGADRCVVARPAAIAPPRRSLIARISQAEPMAWIPGLELLAYASAQRDSADGPSGQVSLLWVNGDPGQVRAALDAGSGLVLHWDAGMCPVSECPVRASFLAAHVVKIERGAFVPGSSAGVEMQCRTLAERSPRAVELSAARRRSFGTFQWHGLPVRASVEIHATKTGLHVARIDRMRTPEEAERVLLEGTTPEALMPALSALGGEQQRSRVDAALHTELDVDWIDLELLRGDEARLAQAARDADALAAHAPGEDAAIAGREDVLAELAYRLELVSQATGDARRAQAQAARVLLQDALGQSPDDEGLALLLTELLLSELHEPEGARALIQRFATRAGANPGWAALERHAAALGSEQALAEVLARQGLLDRRRAREAAHDIVTRMREGQSFERAERGALDPLR
jgi:hypothetical protein